MNFKRLFVLTFQKEGTLMFLSQNDFQVRVKHMADAWAQMDRQHSCDGEQNAPA